MYKNHNRSIYTVSSTAPMAITEKSLHMLLVQHSLCSKYIMKHFKGYPVSSLRSWKTISARCLILETYGIQNKLAVYNLYEQLLYSVGLSTGYPPCLLVAS